MKAIDLAKTSPTLSEILEMAGEENVVLKTSEGRQFVLAEIDDFAEEVAATRRNKALMKLLDQRSQERGTVSLAEMRDQVERPQKTGRQSKRRG